MPYGSILGLNKTQLCICCFCRAEQNRDFGSPGLYTQKMEMVFTIFRCVLLANVQCTLCSHTQACSQTREQGPGLQGGSIRVHD